MDVEHVWVAQPVEVAGQLLVVGSEVWREYPFLGLVLRVLLAFLNPVARVAGLAPEGGLPVLALSDGLVDWQQGIAFSEESYVVPVVNAVVQVVVLDLADGLLANDLASQVKGALCDVATWFSDDSDVLLREVLVDLLPDALSDHLEVLGRCWVDHGEATSDVE